VWDESGMFAFTYDRPTSIWYYLAIVLLPVVSLLWLLRRLTATI